MTEPGLQAGSPGALAADLRWTGERPVVGGWTDGSLAAGGRRPRPAALALGTHGAGRRRNAVPQHAPPGGPRRHASSVTAPARATGPSPLAPGILSPHKDHSQGRTLAALRALTLTARRPVNCSVILWPTRPEWAARPTTTTCPNLGDPPESVVNGWWFRGRHGCRYGLERRRLATPTHRGGHHDPAPGAPTPGKTAPLSLARCPRAHTGR